MRQIDKMVEGQTKTMQQETVALKKQLCSKEAEIDKLKQLAAEKNSEVCKMKKKTDENKFYFPYLVNKKITNCDNQKFNPKLNFDYFTTALQIRRLKTALSDMQDKQKSVVSAYDLEISNLKNEVVFFCWCGLV